MVVRPGVERRHLLIQALPNRQHDDRYLGPRPNPPDHLVPVDPRQAEIEDDHVEGLLGEQRERGLPVGRGSNVVPACRQAGPERSQDLGIVVDDEDGRRRHARRSGSRNTTVAPPPGAPSIQIRPPCDSTIARPMDRPRPAPPAAS